MVVVLVFFVLMCRIWLVLILMVWFFLVGMVRWFGGRGLWEGVFFNSSMMVS